MEILHGIIVIVVAGAAVIAFGLIVFVGYFVVQAIWPALIGLAGGYLLWDGFDQDLGILFVVISFFGQFLLWKRNKRKYIGPIEYPNPEEQERYVRELYFPKYSDQ